MALGASAAAQDTGRIVGTIVDGETGDPLIGAFVVVEADGVVALDVTLTSEAIEVEAVVVKAQAVRNTEAALLRERQKAPAVSDAISAEDISRAGSGDAAEAMTHVTGATVQDGKYVTIRGLGDRYSTVQLNGAELPSADPDRRAVAMDMFPSSMLENIVTGGAVDIGTRSMPDPAAPTAAPISAPATPTTPRL